MPKQKRSKKLGRPEAISPEELLKRYKALRRFLEDNWGRLYLGLKKARNPHHVLAALRLAPGVEWCTPFRECACCFLVEGNKPVGSRELRQVRQKHDEVAASADRLWSEYLNAAQLEYPASEALKAAISQFEAAIGFFPYFFVLFLLAKELAVQDLRTNLSRLMASAHQAKAAKEALTEQRSRQEGWFARNEVLKFIRSKRYELNPMNLAAAMAGLPEYAWLHSLRRCLKIKEVKEKSLDVTLNYRLFQLLEMIIKKTKPLQVKKVEARLRAELLGNGDLWLLREHFGLSWWYIEQVFRACVGKRIKRKEMAYRLMAAIQDNIERPKTIPEQELAKRGRLIQQVVS